MGYNNLMRHSRGLMHCLGGALKGFLGRLAERAMADIESSPHKTFIYRKRNYGRKVVSVYVYRRRVFHIYVVDGGELGLHADLDSQMAVCRLMDHERFRRIKSYLEYRRLRDLYPDLPRDYFVNYQPFVLWGEGYVAVCFSDRVEVFFEEGGVIKVEGDVDENLSRMDEISGGSKEEVMGLLDIWTLEEV